MFKLFFQKPALLSDEEFIAIYQEIAERRGNYQDLADAVDMTRLAAQLRARLLRSIGTDLPRLRQNYGNSPARMVRARYGDDFYKRIGSMGGKKSKGGGFATNPELARRAGRIGGKKSRGFATDRNGLTGSERAKAARAKSSGRWGKKYD